MHYFSLQPYFYAQQGYYSCSVQAVWLNHGRRLNWNVNFKHSYRNPSTQNLFFFHWIDFWGYVLWLIYIARQVLDSWSGYGYIRPKNGYSNDQGSGFRSESKSESVQMETVSVQTSCLESESESVSKSVSGIVNKPLDTRTRRFSNYGCPSRIPQINPTYLSKMYVTKTSGTQITLSRILIKVRNQRTAQYILDMSWQNVHNEIFQDLNHD